MDNGAPAAPSGSRPSDGTSLPPIDPSRDFRADIELLIREALEASEAVDSHDIRDEASRAIFPVLCADADGHLARLIFYCLRNGPALLEAMGADAIAAGTRSAETSAQPVGCQSVIAQTPKSGDNQ